MKLIKSKKGFVLLATLLVAVASAVGAYAYFTSTGHGTGSAQVGAATTWDVGTAGYVAGADPMTPGGGATTYQTVDYTVTNNSPGHQNLNNVNIKVATNVGGVWSDSSNAAQLFGGGAAPACTGADFELSIDGGTTWTAGDVGVDDTRAAGNYAPADAATRTITIRMIDNGNDQDNCAGLSVPLYLFAS